MNFIKLKQENQIPYPVGCDMEQTKGIVKEMSEKIRILYSSDVGLNLFVRGSSGSIISGLLSGYLLDYMIKINHIKKPGESSHFGTVCDEIYGYINIIIDDFMCSGETLNEIYSKCVEYNGQKFTVHLLCISGNCHEKSLKFTPLNIIAGDIYLKKDEVKDLPKIDW